jgi:phage terminase large subunit-like protein
MTLVESALRGSQRPRVLTRPDFVSEDAGVEAIELAESVGLRLDPWQKTIVRVILAEDRRGLYAAREVGYLVSRQNGKGAALEAVALHGMFLVGDPLTLWTAHQFKTSSEAFLRMKGWIDGSDDLRRHVRRVVSAHGEEGFELHNGVRLRFLARSKSSGRGFSPQRIIFDEAQELAKVAAEAMLPSMRAQRNRQAIYTGTVPGPEINNPEHWRRVRDRGRAGGEGRLAWLEWTPKGSDDPAAKIDLGF